MIGSLAMVASPAHYTEVARAKLLRGTLTRIRSQPVAQQSVGQIAQQKGPLLAGLLAYFATVCADC